LSLKIHILCGELIRRVIHSFGDNLDENSLDINDELDMLLPY